MLALRFVGGAIEMSHGWLASFLIFTLSAVGGTILSAIFLPDAISVGASGGIFGEYESHRPIRVSNITECNTHRNADFLGFIGACLADIMMNWSLLFSDFVTENGKKHRHATVVIVLLLDIVLNCIIGLTPYVDNFSRKCDFNFRYIVLVTYKTVFNSNMSLCSTLTDLGGMVYGLLCGMCTIQRLSADFFGVTDEGWKGQAKQIVTRFCGIIVSLVSIVTTLVVLFQGDPSKSPCPECTWLSCVPFPPWGKYDEKWWYCDDCGRVTADVVSKPSLHLAVDCPSGVIAYIDLNESNYDRNRVQKKLPQYCREYCPLFESGLNASSFNML